MERRADPRRETEEAKLRGILNATADGIVVVDHDGVVRFANPAAEALFGRLVGHVFGFPVTVGGTTEVEVVGRSGAHAIVEMRIVDTDWDGAPARLAALRDISDRRRAEEDRAERLRAELARDQAEAAVRARDAFLAMAAHELKTPVTRLSLAVQRDQRRGAAADRRATLRLVERECAHLTRLVRQLVDVARIESGGFALSKAETDVSSLLERAVAVASGGVEDHVITVRLPGEPVVAAVDPVALENALTDLLASAVRYTPAGTAISAELNVVDANGGGTAARVVVRDDGPPVPADVRAALAASRLPPYDDADVPGPGIALHVVRRVAELHGGGLDVEFPEEGGTRTVLTVPRA